ncbi:MAG: PQQ-binding-like beta-propeller repeat protein [Steroidobacteraceae bacterium]
MTHSSAAGSERTFTLQSFAARRWYKALAFVAACSGSLALDAQVLDGSTQQDWPGYGGSAAAWRHSALDQINTDNVDKLQSVWAFHTGDDGDGLTATPIVIDGLMYISTPTNQVFALDARTGDPLWHYTYTPRPNHVKPGSQGSFVQNRGVAVQGDKVFMSTIDSQLVALDRATGKEVWRVAVDDSRQCRLVQATGPMRTSCRPTARMIYRL